MHWVIGDIHGMAKPLRALLAAVAARDKQARFCFAGDYVNRGPDSREVIDILLTLQNARFCRGNHDDIFDLVINGKSFDPSDAGGDRVVAFQWFMAHGLDRTFESYGIDPAFLEVCAQIPSVRALEDIVAVVPESHRRFIRNLAPFIDDAEFFVAHAKWGTEQSDNLLTDQLLRVPALKRQIIWGRFTDEQLAKPKNWRRTGFFGHTPVIYYEAAKLGSDTPRVIPVGGPNIILLDTGCALAEEGRLTAYCVEAKAYLQVNRACKIVPPGD